MSADTASPGPAKLFGRDMAESYDTKNASLAPISGAMHFLTGLALEGLPSDARILCIGAGTGAEILSLGATREDWSFVAVDPSAEMLEVCADRLTQAGLRERCQLVHGYVEDAPEGPFDAVLSILVSHFIAREVREGFYRQVRARLAPGGIFVSTEISYDLDAPAFPAMLRNWERVQSRMGATRESLDALPEVLRDKLSVLSPAETESALIAAGFDTPVRFFQAFMIHGWHARA